ncbi:MAG: aldo/keto reductase [Candidatus Baltobacteraceae bacterium]
MPRLGQGTWDIPTRGVGARAAREALREGIGLGMVHLDTAEMYGEGASEEFIAEAIEGIPREALFVVSKVLPSNGSFKGTIAACERSLRRLRTEYLDCYLLHWREGGSLEPTLHAFERLIDDGKIRRFGVSNFDLPDLREALSLGLRYPIACNQVLYHLGERGIERAVLPFCRERAIALVGYSPFGSGGFPASQSTGGRVLARLAERHGATPYAVALAFLVRLDGTFTIPKAASVGHVRANARGDAIELAPVEIAELTAAFPLPERDGPLAML